MQALRGLGFRVRGRLGLGVRVRVYGVRVQGR